MHHRLSTWPRAAAPPTTARARRKSASPRAPRSRRRRSCPLWGNVGEPLHRQYGVAPAAPAAVPRSPLLQTESQRTTCVPRRAHPVARAARRLHEARAGCMPAGTAWPTSPCAGVLWPTNERRRRGSARRLNRAARGFAAHVSTMEPIQTPDPPIRGSMGSRQLVAMRGPLLFFGGDPNRSVPRAPASAAGAPVAEAA
jgi:hypothetical protein